MVFISSLIWKGCKWVRRSKILSGFNLNMVWWVGVWVGWWMGHSFDMLTFDFLLKLPQPVTGLFFKKIWKTWVLFEVPLIPLFWTSGDIFSGFQSQSRQPYLYLAEVYMLRIPWDSPLVWHLLTSWQPAWQSSCLILIPVRHLWDLNFLMTLKIPHKCIGWGHFWNMSLSRWFKFTVKTTYRDHTWQITIGHVGHFIFDFFVKFGHKGP